MTLDKIYISVRIIMTETNSATFIMRLGGGGSLKFCNTSGDQKNFTHTVGGITKNSQNLENFQRPPSR